MPSWRPALVRSRFCFSRKGGASTGQLSQPRFVQSEHLLVADGHARIHTHASAVYRSATTRGDAPQRSDRSLIRPPQFWARSSRSSFTLKPDLPLLAPHLKPEALRNASCLGRGSAVERRRGRGAELPGGVHPDDLGRPGDRGPAYTLKEGGGLGSVRADPDRPRLAGDAGVGDVDVVRSRCQAGASAGAEGQVLRAGLLATSAGRRERCCRGRWCRRAARDSRSRRCPTRAG